MVAEDKLRQFETYVVTKAETGATQSVRAVDKTIELKLREETKKYQKWLDKEIRNEIEKLRINKNRVIYQEKLAREKELATYEREYKKRIIKDVTDKLNEFVQTKDYMIYLNRVIERVDKEDYTIYLTPEDYEKKDQLSIKFAKCEAGDDFIGGYKAVVKNKVIDQSLLTKLRSNYANT